MSAVVDKIAPEILALPITDRAELARKLIDSLDSDFDDDVGDAWGAEVARRSMQIAEGSVECVGFDDTVTRIRRKLKYANQEPS